MKKFTTFVKPRIKGTPELVIGIDFGTTFSGIAWALSTNLEKIYILKEWPGDAGTDLDSPKAPSTISYNEKKEVSGWGFDKESKDHHLKWFKLLLCEEAEHRAASRQAHFNQLRDDMDYLKKNPEDVVADYLGQLWQHAMEVLRRVYGRKLMAKFSMRVVITVPAIWGHAAKNLTKKALMGAIGSQVPETAMEVIGEPEAAALAVFDDMAKQNLPTLETGDCFVICDCGGGTVDLISYQIEATSPLKLSMCTKASGGLHGAVYLDYAFEDKLEEQVELEKLSFDTKKTVMETWEHKIKRPFRFRWKVKQFKIRFTAVATAMKAFMRKAGKGLMSLIYRQGSSERKEVVQTFTAYSTIIKNNYEVLMADWLIREEIEAIFNTVCPPILDLVDAQILEVRQTTSQRPKAIFLVGGFGANHYLHQSLQERFLDIEVRRPTDAWTAVCRGAVLSGLAPQGQIVSNHISSYNYGIVVDCLYDEEIHIPEDKYFNQLQLKWKAKNQMRWYIKRDESVSKAAFVRKPWQKSYANSAQLGKVETAIYYSKNSKPGNRFTQDVKQLCTISFHLDQTAWDDLEVCHNSTGTEYRKVNYEISMDLSSGIITWRVFYKGEERDHVRVDYEHAFVTD